MSPTRRQRGEGSVSEALMSVLTDHVGTATTFCRACPGWRPDDLDEDERVSIRRHQVDMLFAANIVRDPATLAADEAPVRLAKVRDFADELTAYEAEHAAGDNTSTLLAIARDLLDIVGPTLTEDPS